MWHLPGSVGYLRLGSCSCRRPRIIVSPPGATDSSISSLLVLIKVSSSFLPRWSRGCGEVSWWSCGSVFREVSPGGQKWGLCRYQPLPASAGGSAPVLHPKLKSLAPSGWAWSSARQGEFIPLSIAMVLTDWSSAKGEDNAEPYNQLLGFPELQFLALQFKFESWCLDIVCSWCFAVNSVEMK